jgi:hypothetical protein
MGIVGGKADSNHSLIMVRENSVNSSDGLTALNCLTDVPEFQILQIAFFKRTTHH